MTTNKDISEDLESQKNKWIKNKSQTSSNNPRKSKKKKKEELNNSLSNIRQVSSNSINHINQVTPISKIKMCPYEAESSPTTYIKSTSNINNFTYLTNNISSNNNNNCNNNSRICNKSKNSFIHITKEQSEGISLRTINKGEEEQQKSYSHTYLNQSEFT